MIKVSEVGQEIKEDEDSIEAPRLAQEGIARAASAILM